MTSAEWEKHSTNTKPPSAVLCCSQYERYGEVQWLSVPASAGGQLEMLGTDDGHFTLEVREKQGNDLKKQVNFTRVPTQKGMQVTLGFEKKDTGKGKKAQSIVQEDAISDDLELSIDRHTGILEKVQTREKTLKEKPVKEEEKEMKIETAPTSATALTEQVIEATSSPAVATTTVPMSGVEVSTSTATSSLEITPIPLELPKTETGTSTELVATTTSLIKKNNRSN